MADSGWRREVAEQGQAIAGAYERTNDPWSHRAAGMRCQSCMWFVAKTVLERTTAPSRGALGRCRRHAPTMSGFPAVFETDWCGDHKLDEGKV